MDKLNIHGRDNIEWKGKSYSIVEINENLINEVIESSLNDQVEYDFSGIDENIPLVKLFNEIMENTKKGSDFRNQIENIDKEKASIEKDLDVINSQQDAEQEGIF